MPRLVFLAAVALTPCPALAQLPQFVLSTPPDIASQQFERVRCADVDGDGDLDVLGFAGLTVFSSSLSLLRNDGGGVFTDLSPSLPPLPNGIQHVSWFDADGDGDLDAFLCVVNAPCRVLRNVGGGTFVLGASVAAAVGQTGSAVADFDGDGDLDVAVAGFALLGSRDRLLLNDGTGNFPTELFLGVPFNSTIVAGDLEADGDPDLILIDSGSGVRVLRNDGALSFVDVSATQVALLPTSAPTTGLGLDLEGDGDIDLVVRGGANGEDSYLQNVGGVLTEIGPLPGPTSSFRFALADVDGDGDTDVLRSVQPTGLALSLNDGVGGFVDGSARISPPGLTSWYIALADLDADGDPEVLLTSPLAPVRVLRNRDVDLEVDAAAVGQPWTCRLRTRPGYASAGELVRLGIGLAALPQATAVPGVGLLWLDLGAPHVLLDQLAPAPDGTARFALAIPGSSALVGVTLHCQGLVGRAPGLPRLTAWIPTTIQ